MLYKKYKDLKGPAPPSEPPVGSHNPWPVLRPQTETADGVIKISSPEQRDRLVAQNKVCLMYVFAKWCGPCKKLGPQFADLTRRYSKLGLCALFKEDVDLFLKDDLSSVPTFIFYKDGKMVDMTTGSDLYGDDGVEEKLLELLTSL